ncbi:MAG: AtpZ/AtpI family protein [Candidatus Saccharimonadales bacterium]
MVKTATAPRTTTPVTKGGDAKSTIDESVRQRNLFLTMAIDMSWRLAVSVLIPVIGGHYLDEHFNKTPLLTLLGMVVALALSAAVIWRALKMANSLPVPQLTKAQRRAIRKSYEKEEADE